jgi:hypothetical protein
VSFSHFLISFISLQITFYNGQPRTIVDHTFFGINMEPLPLTVPEAMQFGQALEHILYNPLCILTHVMTQYTLSRLTMLMAADIAMLGNK